VVATAADAVPAGSASAFRAAFLAISASFNPNTAASSPGDLNLFISWICWVAGSINDGMIFYVVQCFSP